MRQNSLFRILLLSLMMSVVKLQAQTLQVTLSHAPKVNRTTSGGTATIFFDSNIEDLSIICTEENTTGRCLQILEGHTGYVRSVAFSPDGRHIVSASDDKMIRILDSPPSNNLLTRPVNVSRIAN